MGVGSLSTPEPEGLYYRFSVKCDRLTNSSIEKAAKKAGMTPTTFVQKHFETILTGGPIVVQSGTPDAPEKDPRFDFDVAQGLGITVSSLRLLRVMNRAKDGNGNVQMSQLALAEAAGCAPASVAPFQMKLIRRGLIRQVAAPGHRTPAIWHVEAVGDDI